MDLMHLQEQLVLLEARALELGMASPTPHLLEELRYCLHDVTLLQGHLPKVNGTSALRARADSVYAEIQGLMVRWDGTVCSCAA